MHSTSAIALVGFITWTLLLLLLMELARVRLVVASKFDPRQFRPDNANLSPFMQRLARAHANCVESFPVFGGLLLVALATGQTSVTDPLALVLLGTRIVQSSVHVASLSTVAVNVRFLAFAVQVVIALYWAYWLLMGVIR
ncbi:MAPEG family protein [compost metagenome]